MPLGIGAGLLLSGIVGTAGQAVSNWITRAREDTAVQRRAADMQAAGINPTLAAGNPAESKPLKGALTEGAEKAALALQMMKMKADISLADSQRANVDADTTLKNQNAQYGSNTMESRIAQAKALSLLDTNKAEAESIIRTYYDAKSDSAFRGNSAQMRAHAESYDSMLRSAEAGKAEMAFKLQEQAFKMVAEYGVKNPVLMEYLSKAVAYEILSKERDWFERKQWMSLGSTAVGGAAGIARTLYGGAGLIQ